MCIGHAHSHADSMSMLGMVGPCVLQSLMRKELGSETHTRLNANTIPTFTYQRILKHILLLLAGVTILIQRSNAFTVRRVANDIVCVGGMSYSDSA
jgi:hypothetical protein